MRDALVNLGPGLAAAAFILLALWCFSHRRVDHSLAALGLYLGLLDGYVKLRTGSPVVTLGRDVLVAAIAGGALLRSLSSRQPLPLPPLGGLVVGFAAVVMIEMFNPSAPGWIQSLAGVRQHLEFVPLFFLGFAFIRRESQVRTLAMILVICAAAGGVVSLVQSLLTPEQLAQWGPGYRERIYGTGAFTGAGRVAVDAAGNAAVRPFGLGSEVGGGASAAALALPALIALIMNAGRRFPLIYVPLAVGIALAVITSGSRAATVAVVLSVVAFAVIAAVSRNAVRVMVGLAIASVLIVAVFQQISPGNAAKNRVDSVTPSKISATFSQERGSTLKTFGRYAQAYPLGVGIGTVGPAAAVSGERNTAVLDAETLWNFLIIETGLPGLALIVALLLRMMWIALVRIRRNPDRKMRLYLAALAAPLFGLAAAGFAGPTTISVPSAPFLWFVAGILSYWLMRRPDSHGRPPPALVQAREYREPPIRPLPAHVARS